MAFFFSPFAIRLVISNERYQGLTISTIRGIILHKIKSGAKLMDYRVKQHKVWAQDGYTRGCANAQAPRKTLTLKVSKFGGFAPTKTETTSTQMLIRSDRAIRSRKVKPSMPKMPWDAES